MEHDTGLLVLVFVIGSIIVGSITMIFTKKLKLPYSVALLVIGLILGGLDRSGVFYDFMPIISDSLHLISDVDPHLFLFVFFTYFDI